MLRYPEKQIGNFPAPLALTSNPAVTPFLSCVAQPGSVCFDQAKFHRQILFDDRDRTQFAIVV